MGTTPLLRTLALLAALALRVAGIEVDPDNNATVSQEQEQEQAPLPLVFLHFHKAGGTSVCQVLRNSTLRTPIDKHGKVDKGCNCRRSVPLGGSGADLAGALATDRVDACAVEHSWLWPTPGRFREMVAGFNGTLSTLLRDPWARFRSNYQRDFHLVLVRENTRMAVADFGGLRGDRSTNVRTWGPYNRPNFYVRLLNGLATADSALLPLGREHLEEAKSVLSLFDSVMVLSEAPSAAAHRAKTLSALVGVPGTDLPHLTNNIHSQNGTIGSKRPNRGPRGGGRSRKGSRNTRGRPGGKAGVAPDSDEVLEEYRLGVWQAANTLDVELYEWAESALLSGVDRRLYA